MRNRLRRLERAADEEMVLIPQRDGSIVKFPPEALEVAFMTSLERLKGNLDLPEHPLSTAAANSSDAAWRATFTAGTHQCTEEIPDDLSE